MNSDLECALNVLTWLMNEYTPQFTVNSFSLSEFFFSYCVKAYVARTYTLSISLREIFRYTDAITETLRRTLESSISDLKDHKLICNY